MKPAKPRKSKPFEKLGRLLDEKLEEAERRIAAAKKKLESKGRGKKKPEGVSYLKTLLKDSKVASVTPSSRYVVRKVVEQVSPEGAGSLVEYGPGDGVITRGLLGALGPGARLIAIERNPDFMKGLRRLKDPRLVPIEGDVRLTERYVRAEGLSSVDRVVSGIPFSMLKPREREDLLAMTGRLLKPGGRMVIYQFTATLIPLLKRHFREVDIGYEVRNLPPLFVFTCVK